LSDRKIAKYRRPKVHCAELGEHFRDEVALQGKPGMAMAPRHEVGTFRAADLPGRFKFYQSGIVAANRTQQKHFGRGQHQTQYIIVLPKCAIGVVFEFEPARPHGGKGAASLEAAPRQTRQVEKFDR